MEPKFIEGSWYIEIFTEEFGYVLLLEKGDIPIPIKFESAQEALNYIKEIR